MVLRSVAFKIVLMIKLVYVPCTRTSLLELIGKLIAYLVIKGMVDESKL